MRPKWDKVWKRNKKQNQNKRKYEKHLVAHDWHIPLPSSQAILQFFPSSSPDQGIQSLKCLLHPSKSDMFPLPFFHLLISPSFLPSRPPHSSCPIKTFQLWEALVYISCFPWHHMKISTTHVAHHGISHVFIHPIIWFASWLNISFLVYASHVDIISDILYFYSVSYFVSSMFYHILSQLSFKTSCEVSKTDINIINFYVDKCRNRLSREGDLSTADPQDQNCGFQKLVVVILIQSRHTTFTSHLLLVCEI